MANSQSQPNITVKLGGMLPLNQKVLASLDSRNVAAHPWHDLEIGELCSCHVTSKNSTIYKEIGVLCS